MTAVVKAQQASEWRTVRSLFGASASNAPSPPQDAQEAAGLAAERTIAELRSLVEARDAALEGARRESDEAYERGVARGRELGLSEATDCAEERVEVLAAGVGGALDAFRGELRGLERLAPKLARSALAKLIGDPGEREALLIATIKQQLRALEHATVVVVEVSRADFPSGSDVEALAQALETPDLRIRRCEDVEGGGCRIRLTLGRLEAGLGAQWSELSRFLDALGEAEACA